MEVGLKFLRVEGSTHDDHLELSVLGPLFAFGQYLHQQSHQNIRCQRAFVRLIEHDDGIAAEQRIIHRLAEEHTICEKFEHRLIGIAHVLESNGVPHRFSQRHVHLFGHTRGDAGGSDTSRLGASHACFARLGVSALDEKLGYLRSLSASCLSLHDDCLTAGHGLEELRLKLIYRELEAGLEDGLVAGGVRPSSPGVDVGRLPRLEGLLVFFSYFIGVQFDPSFTVG
mmetsp:Transcript_42219/g.72096  ORF Transcript_42219/g.72096 Transcript_42219/m.72096 type:complete len:227 (+) Transcript_42219:1576-2256(+)